MPKTSLTEGNRNQSDAVVNPEPRKYGRGERNALLATEVGDRHPTEHGSYEVHCGSSSSPLLGAMDHSPVQGLFTRARISRKITASFLLQIDVLKQEAFSLGP